MIYVNQLHKYIESPVFYIFFYFTIIKHDNAYNSDK